MARRLFVRRMLAERASQQIAFAAHEVLSRHSPATFFLHPQYCQQSFARLHRKTGLFRWCFDGGGESDDDAGRFPRVFFERPCLVNPQH